MTDREKLEEIILEKHIYIDGHMDTDTFVVVPIKVLADALLSVGFTHKDTLINKILEGAPKDQIPYGGTHADFCIIMGQNEANAAWREYIEGVRKG